MCKYYNKSRKFSDLCIALTDYPSYDLSKCPNCKTKINNDGATFCKNCGFQLKQKEIRHYCKYCNSDFDTSYIFCDKDGNKLIVVAIEKDSKNNASDLPMNWYNLLTGPSIKKCTCS
ncbi:MAG: zinc ribbon domain-containing protein [Candidatus Marinimicrobia bacterium]|nr:zinc ribbon domain-containing protein [Candidatus Neomarinimicrobiota bacterium]